MSGVSASARVLVWDLPTRVFHWLLAGSFVGAFLTAESERWRDLHVLLGYTVLALVLFRLIWGVVGTRHARFSSFLFGPRRVADYLGALASRRPRHFVGHNPAGSWAILALLVLALVTAATGFAAFYAFGGDAAEELHEAAANAMLYVVLVHVAGVIVGSLVHRENLAWAMVTGIKRGAAQDAIARSRRLVALGLLAAVVGLWTGIVPTPGLDRGGGAESVAAGTSSGHNDERDDD